MRTVRPIHYLQYDKRWGAEMFSSHNDPMQTIASSGCGATSSAMVLATFLDKSIAPPDVAEVILANGYRTYNNGVDWGWFPFMARYYGLPYKTTITTDEAIAALRESALIVASMGPGYFTKFGHYIMLWGLNENTCEILVNDPNSTVRTKAAYSLFKAQAVRYFIFYGQAAAGGAKTSADTVTILVGGKKVNGLLKGSTTYAPIRVVAETLGAAVGWDGATQKVTVTKGNVLIVLKIGSTEVAINGRGVAIGAPALLINDTTMVPVRFVAEALGKTVKWDGPTKTVTIE